MRLLSSLFAAGTLLLSAAFAAQPNIVFILADDLGWRDLHCYGSPWYDTPNLDRLASQGTRFTAGYAAAPICSASRAALLTGRSPARLGFEFVVKDPGSKPPPRQLLSPPPYPEHLPLEEVTLAEVLGPAGYATGYFGKWHLNQHFGSYLQWSDTLGPLQQGYAEGDKAFGSHPYGDAERPPGEKGDLPKGDYGRDDLTEKAVAFLRAHRDGPFYLHVAHYYVHEPVRTRAKWLAEKYAARLPAGADPKRAAYAAMVETLDHLVGELLRTLDELKLTENTLVIFTSDNGGTPLYSAHGPLRGSKWNLYEGGVRVPWIVRWPGHVPAGATNDTPFIGTDLLPTLAAAGRAKLPRGVALDGENVLEVWQGQGPGPSNRALTWHFPYYHPEVRFDAALPKIGIDDFALSQTRPQSAIRVGDWTLVHFYEHDRDELYQLSTDPSQQHDLAAAQPVKARELRKRLDESLQDAGARIPTPSSKEPAMELPPGKSKKNQSQG